MDEYQNLGLKLRPAKNEVEAGLFAVQPWFAAVAALGLVTAAVYSLWMMQQAFQGSPEEQRQMADFDGREMTAMLAMMVALLWLGVYPQPVLDLAQPVLDGLHGLLQHSELLAGVGQ